MNIYSILFIGAILLVVLSPWIVSGISNIGYTFAKERRVIENGGAHVAHVPTRSAREEPICQHVKDVQKWEAYYRGETKEMPNNGYIDPAYYNKRARVEGQEAAGRHKDDPGGG